MTTATILPLPRACFFDANGNPLASGLVYTYVAGTTTPKTTWQDAGETTPNTNPIVLDANGSCLLYGSGSYTLTVTDALGNNIPAYSGLTVDSLSQAITIISPAIANIAALRASTTTTLSQAQCYVLGFSSAADGGQGEFLYVSSDTTSSDNGGTIIVDASGRRWYRDTQGQPLNIQWFGAKGDGATDDTSAITAAVNAATSTGVYIPGKASATAYVVSGTINLTAPFLIYGDGEASVISTSSATADVFVAVGSGLTMRDFCITSSVVRTAGAYIKFGSAGVSFVLISHIHMTKQFTGIDFGTGNTSIIDLSESYIYDTASHGFGIFMNSANAFDISFHHILMDTSASPQPTAGIWIQNCGDVTMEDCSIIHHGHDMVLSPAAGQTVGSIYCTDSYFDMSVGNGLRIQPDSTGIVSNCHFKGCWFCGHTGTSTAASGINITLTSGSPIIEGVDFSFCDIKNNAYDGITVGAGIQVALHGCNILLNANAGIDVGAGISQFTLLGNFVTQNTVAGIFIQTGASDYFIVANNNCHGNTAANFSNGGTGVNVITTPNITV